VETSCGMLFREAILHVSMLALSCIFGKGRSSQETNLFWGRLWKSGHENLRVGSQHHHEQMGPVFWSRKPAFDTALRGPFGVPRSSRNGF
jgi:hypothetical protein